MIHPWKQLSTKLQHENPFWKYRVDSFESGAGKQGKYYYCDQPLAVDIFARLDDGRFVMIREWRYIAGKVSLSCAMGGVEREEDPEVAAGRELEEETGYKAGKMTHLKTIVTAPAFSTESIHLYFAEDLSHVGQRPEEHGEQEVVLMTVDEIDVAIDAGDIWDSNSIACWFLLKRHLETN